MPSANDLKIPVHIAVIMDGNGRWARQRGLPRQLGHRQGVKALREIVRTCGEIGVKFLTAFTFSTENWQRPAQEIENLMKLLARAIEQERAELIKNNVRVRAIGRLTDLPEWVQKKLRTLITETKANTGLNLTLALSYGGRAEIIDALKKAYALWRSGQLSRPPRTEEEFTQLLYDPDLPPVDLLIRTGGEQRISNFLLWQSAYAELFFTETLWPDFRREQLMTAIVDFSRRQRRFGRIDEK